MKKIGAILLIFCMVMSIAMVPAYATSTITFTKAAHYVDTRLNGAYDHTAGELAVADIAAAMRASTSSTARIRLDAYGEWVEINISDQAAGTYSVNVDYQNQSAVTTLDFIVDGNLELRVTPTLVTSGTSGLNSVGQIYVPSGVSGLKVKNVGSAAIEFKQISITSVGAEDTSANIVFSGTDTTYSDTSGTRNLLVDYFDGVCRAEGGNYTVSCDNSCENYEDGRGYHRAYTPSTIYTDGSWFRYDVSDLADGTYEVIANVSAREGAGAKLSLDGTETQAVTLDSQGATGTTFGAAYDQSLGKITISGTSQYLKLIQTGEAVFMVHQHLMKAAKAETML